MTDSLPTIDPRHTALLVMDYQPAVLAATPDAEALLGRARQAIDTARRHGAHVGYVRVGFTDADLAAIPAHSPMAAAARHYGDQMHADAPATQVHESLAPQPNDIVVRKTRVGAFGTTDLHRQLRDRDVDTLVLAGISTSGVMLSTVRDAHDRDFRVLVLADATADRNPDVHRFLTEQIFPHQAAVLGTADLDGRFAA
ncbi:hypothetical protein Athai_09470 [Actinocatenispora thailandica]|uniref:Isochorismatase-like domain-containing protein n=1 Tax=Actinocatenispora thailandica TaxID=227318 RepID=A0A7R7DKL7_9ACTN|nr:cysteine hydrolase [Actinocatenispora thailandica]BCJ33444.1 hypothetical protein Athai_09470 [Actinocatenispora thailandica]